MAELGARNKKRNLDQSTIQEKNYIKKYRRKVNFESVANGKGGSRNCKESLRFYKSLRKFSTWTTSGTNVLRDKT